jgi:hypothetical protein
MRVYPTDNWPFERTEVVEPGTAQGMQRVDWSCSKGCCSYADADQVLRRVRGACKTHRVLIPSEEN